MHQYAVGSALLGLVHAFWRWFGWGHARSFCNSQLILPNAGRAKWHACGLFENSLSLSLSLSLFEIFFFFCLVSYSMHEAWVQAQRSWLIIIRGCTSRSFISQGQSSPLVTGGIRAFLSQCEKTGLCSCVDLFAYCTFELIERLSWPIHRNVHILVDPVNWIPGKCSHTSRSSKLNSQEECLACHVTSLRNCSVWFVPYMTSSKYHAHPKRIDLFFFVEFRPTYTCWGESFLWPDRRNSCIKWAVSGENLPGDIFY